MAQPDLPNDDLLLERLRAGDEQGSRAFFDAYVNVAYQVASGVVREYNEAMDIVQESFIKAFRSIDGFRGQAGLGTWFRRIVINTSLDHLRRRRATREVAAGDQLEAIAGASPGRATHSPVDEASARELAQLIAQATERIPEPQRLVLTLFVHGGMTYAEIAEQLAIPVGTVMSRLFHARRHLREALAGTGYVNGFGEEES